MTTTHGHSADHNRHQQRIVYVHGCGPQPKPSELKRNWDVALFGHDVGEVSKSAHWRQILPNSRLATQEQLPVRFSTMTPDEIVTETVKTLTSNPAKRKVLTDIVARTEAEGERMAIATGIEDVTKAQFRRQVAIWLASEFLPDINMYLFNAEQRRVAEDGVIQRLRTKNQLFTVVAHEIGALVAFGAIRRLRIESNSESHVCRFFTIGSPLGMNAIWSNLPDISENDELPAFDEWINFCNPLDPVGNYYMQFLGDDNKVLPASELEFELPQVAENYLRSQGVRQAVRTAFGSEFGQVLSSFRVAGDVVRMAEDNVADKRHELLIEYSDIKARDDESPQDLLRAALVEVTGNKKLSGPEGVNEPQKLEFFERYAAASLNREELENLSAKLELNITIWRDAPKRALINESIHTVQAYTAQRGYDATGRGIGWAVLDTGVDAGHPHFRKYRNIAGQWDCTRSSGNGEPIPEKNSKDLKDYWEYDDFNGWNKFLNWDLAGHGTHVAGIISGCFDEELYFSDDKERKLHGFCGIAPETKIYSFRVLNDHGVGSDRYLIKALDHIARLNERAESPIIHGVNLSLGGPYDPEVYGCGHTPLCRELQRLWNQGVVVVVAAGNDGLLKLDSGKRINQALSIEEPGNLDEAISVGSIHKCKPFTYGVSHFSSRGPTADGRSKPDLVAPGEKIYSAKARARNSNADRVEELYVALSGTSMAAPHVSGILASFLSRRPEFKGYPNLVKEILLKNCESLGRDPYFQGKGLPNAVSMLLQTKLAE